MHPPLQLVFTIKFWSNSIAHLQSICISNVLSLSCSIPLASFFKKSNVSPLIFHFRPLLYSDIFLATKNQLAIQTGLCANNQASDPLNMPVKWLGTSAAEVRSLHNQMRRNDSNNDSMLILWVSHFLTPNWGKPLSRWTFVKTWNCYQEVARSLNRCYKIEVPKLAARWTSDIGLMDHMPERFVRIMSHKTLDTFRITWLAFRWHFKSNAICDMSTRHKKTQQYYQNNEKSLLD